MLLNYQSKKSYTLRYHQAGYSVVRSLSEAPKYASVIAKVLKQGQLKDGLASGRSYGNISMQGEPVFVFRAFSRRLFSSVHYLASIFQCLLIYLLFSLEHALATRKEAPESIFSVWACTDCSTGH